jgi:hypothetical protein
MLSDYEISYYWMGIYLQHDSLFYIRELCVSIRTYIDKWSLEFITVDFVTLP